MTAKLCKAWADMREMAKSEGKSEGKEEGREEGRKEGREEGIILGREEGIQLGRKETAEKIMASMKEYGMPEGQIGEILRNANVGVDGQQSK